MEHSLWLAQVTMGQYVSWWKAIPLLLVLLAWARVLTWIDKDAPRAMLPQQALNLGFVGGGVFAFLLFFLLPNFFLALLALVIVLGAEAGVYLYLRNQKVGLADIRGQFVEWIKTRTPGKGERKHEAPPGQVALLSRGGDPIPEPDVESPDRVPFDAAQALLTEPLRRHAEKLEMIPVDADYAVRYTVDGVVYAGPRIEKPRGAQAITFLKALAGLDLNERRKPQTGSMKVLVDGRRDELRLETAGSAAGEQVRAAVNVKTWYNRTLDNIGMTDDQIDAIRESIQDNSGIVLVAAPKGQGLTSTLYAILRAHDAFLSHIVTLEPNPDVDLEGITQNKLPAASNPAEDLRITEWVLSQEPDVVMASRVEDTRVAMTLVRFAESNRRVYVGLRAPSAFDALNQWRKLIGDDRTALKDLKMVIAGRVLRKLCGACKIGYAPDQAMLKKLNIDPTQVAKLYQARTGPLRDAKGNPVPCEFCKELYYKGRTGIFEIFKIDDEVRAVIESGGTANQLKALFRKQRAHYLQEQGLRLVEQGDTSVQEVLRVMKIGDPAAAARSAAVPAAPAAGPPPPHPSAR